MWTGPFAPCAYKPVALAIYVYCSTCTFRRLETRIISSNSLWFILEFF